MRRAAIVAVWLLATSAAHAEVVHRFPTTRKPQEVEKVACALQPRVSAELGDHPIDVTVVYGRLVSRCAWHGEGEGVPMVVRVESAEVIVEVDRNQAPDLGDAPLVIARTLEQQLKPVVFSANEPQEKPSDTAVKPTRKFSPMLTSFAIGLAVVSGIASTVGLTGVIVWGVEEARCKNMGSSCNVVREPEAWGATLAIGAALGYIAGGLAWLGEHRVALSVAPTPGDGATGWIRVSF